MFFLFDIKLFNILLLSDMKMQSISSQPSNLLRHPNKKSNSLDSLSKQCSYFLENLQLNSIEITNECEQILMAKANGIKNNKLKEILNKIHQLWASMRPVYQELTIGQLWGIQNRINLGVCRLAMKVSEGIQNLGDQQITEGNQRNQSKEKKLSQQKNIKVKVENQPKKSLRNSLQSNILTQELLLNGINLLKPSNNNNNNLSNIKQKIQATKKTIIREPVSQKTSYIVQQPYYQYRDKIFKKIYNELQQAQNQLYISKPYPSSQDDDNDQITTFLLFEKKFLQTFNHTSRGDDIRQIQQFFNEALQGANQFVKSYKIKEEIGQYFVRMAQMLKELKISKQQQYEQTLERFEKLKNEFMRKRSEVGNKITEKLEKYEELLALKATKVQFGVNTNVQEFRSIKLYQRVIEQLKQNKKTEMQVLANQYSKKFREYDRKYFDLQKSLVQEKISIRNFESRNKDLQQQIKKLKQYITNISSSNQQPTNTLLITSSLKQKNTSLTDNNHKKSVSQFFQQQEKQKQRVCNSDMKLHYDNKNQLESQEKEEEERDIKQKQQQEYHDTQLEKSSVNLISFKSLHTLKQSKEKKKKKKNKNNIEGINQDEKGEEEDQLLCRQFSKSYRVLRTQKKLECISKKTINIHESCHILKDIEKAQVNKKKHVSMNNNSYQSNCKLQQQNTKILDNYLERPKSYFSKKEQKHRNMGIKNEFINNDSQKKIIKNNLIQQNNNMSHRRVYSLTISAPKNYLPKCTNKNLDKTSEKNNHNNKKSAQNQKSKLPKIRDNHQQQKQQQSVPTSLKYMVENKNMGEVNIRQSRGSFHNSSNHNSNNNFNRKYRQINANISEKFERNYQNYENFKRFKKIVEMVGANNIGDIRPKFNSLNQKKQIGFRKRRNSGLAGRQFMKIKNYKSKEYSNFKNQHSNIGNIYKKLVSIHQNGQISTNNNLTQHIQNKIQKLHNQNKENKQNIKDDSQSPKWLQPNKSKNNKKPIKRKKKIIDKLFLQNKTRQQRFLTSNQPYCLIANKMQLFGKDQHSIR